MAMTARRSNNLTLAFPDKEDAEENDPMEDFAKQGRHRIERPRKKVVPAARHERAVHEANEMARTGDWSNAAARHLVALYDVLHARIYGVEAAELGPQERYQATLFAGSFVKRHFGGDFTDAVEFMKWAWNREAEREKWRRENRKQGSRIGYRLMFSGALLTDYRLAMARQR